MALPVTVVPARTMAHNPKYMREATKARSKLMTLRERVLSGETLIPRAEGAQRRRGDNFYKDVVLEAPILGKQIIPAPARIESWVYNLEKQRVGIAALDNNVWNADVSRVDIVQRVVQWQRACRRQGTHKTLGRSEVSGSGKKKRPQKGGGTSRQSDMLGPGNYHGGHAFPHRPRSFAYTLPMAIRRKGLSISLSVKRKLNSLFVVDAAVADSHKTGALASKLGLFAPAVGRSLLIHGNLEQDPNFMLAVRNIGDFEVLPANGANVIDVVKARTVLVTVQGQADLESRLTARSRSPQYVAAPIRLLSVKEGLARRAALKAAAEGTAVEVPAAATA